MPDGSFNITTTNLDVLIAHMEEVQAAGETGWLDPVTGHRARFFMGSWCGLSDECGTPACMAGHAVLLADPVGFWTGDVHGRWAIPIVAARWLGLDSRSAEQLFHGYDNRGWVYAFEHIRLSEAIETLRRLRATGRVDWSHADGYITRGDIQNALLGSNPSSVNGDAYIDMLLHYTDEFGA